jgi:hypothetical protein
MDQGTTVIRSKVDRYLQSLELAFGAHAETDDELAVRLAFRDEWWDQIDRLDSLCGIYERAEMSEDQAGQFAGVCASMLNVLPLMRQLGLRCPSPANIETARHLAQRGIVAKGA